MAMEKQNKQFQDMLDSLDDLPLENTPNVASKWEILAMGLQGKKPAKKSSLMVYIIGMAALFFAVLIFFWAEPKQGLPLAQVANKIVEKPLYLSPSKVMKNSVLKPINKKKNVVKMNVVEPPVLVQAIDSFLPLESTKLLSLQEPVKVKPRYVEIDFTNEVYAAKFPSANTSEKLVQFRFFKSEISNPSNTQGGSSLLQFKTNF
jgi:hypothetical protein